MLTTEQIHGMMLNYDQNISRLEIIIEGVNKAVTHLRSEELGIDWWGTLDEKYEHELIYRLAILAFEDYLEKTIGSFKVEPSKEKDYLQLYHSEPAIDLIFSLAKYIKWNPDASEQLSKHNLNPNLYPIYHGVLALNEKRDLNAIIKRLQNWRIQLVNLAYFKSE
ncbi:MULTISPECIES: hypothetical protein [Chryseobacterium]|uniref:hypothetical protein n=1 Tax=Chryseobacterium TaxID=59732 RepID=UPI0012977444|nr:MULTISPECIES: hypothetical protein [Chryseobacterium]MDR6922373.1 hypothetical protein [Chryseobacterium sp. 2987]